MGTTNIKKAALLAALLSVTSSCAASQDTTIAPAVPTTGAIAAAATPAPGSSLAEAARPLEPPAGSEATALPANVGPADAAKQDPAVGETVAAERRAIEALDRISPFVPFSREKRGVVFTLRTDDLFEPGASKLSTTANGKLDDLAATLRLQGDKAIEVDGFTDSLGDAAENEDLSSRRADALRAYFVAKGVDSSKVKIAGFGARHPVANNDTSFGRAQNRRVEIVIQDPPRPSVGGPTAHAATRSAAPPQS
jgi:outer membrane protein OmpA-like peptidoglycan-associated protein